MKTMIRSIEATTPDSQVSPNNENRKITMYMKRGLRMGNGKPMTATLTVGGEFWRGAVLLLSK